MLTLTEPELVVIVGESWEELLLFEQEMMLESKLCRFIAQSDLRLGVIFESDLARSLVTIK